MADPVLRVAIIGLGPKGLYALERLLTEAAGARLEIDVFEPHPAPGAGPVYDPTQPAYLRMNLPDDLVDMWVDGSGVVPATERCPYARWRGDGDGVDRFSARAEVGRYLVDGLERLLAHAPSGVRVRVLTQTADLVRRQPAGWLVLAADGAGLYDEVLLATGHEATWSGALSELPPPDVPLVPAVFPVERRLSEAGVPPGSVVAVRGFALTFLDAALALTEGRGGRFEAGGGSGRLRYVPSGAEPAMILPYARRGRPMLAKPRRSVAARIPHVEAMMADGRRRILASGGLDTELLPALATAAGGLAAADGGSGGAAVCASAAHQALTQMIAGRAPDTTLAPSDELRRSVLVGTGEDPPDLAWALGHAWRALYPAIVERCGGFGLSPEDRPGFRRLAVEMERVAFGPPLRSAARLLALVEAGVVDLTHVASPLELDRGRSVLRSSTRTRSVDVVVDAVLPPPGPPDAGTGLWAQLRADGQVRVSSGRRGIDVDAEGGCRTAGGAPATGLSAIGRVTEDVVIGNDTLTRTLHPAARRWAARVAIRAHRRAERGAA